MAHRKVVAETYLFVPARGFERPKNAGQITRAAHQVNRHKCHQLLVEERQREGIIGAQEGTGRNEVSHVGERGHPCLLVRNPGRHFETFHQSYYVLVTTNLNLFESSISDRSRDGGAGPSYRFVAFGFRQQFQISC